MAVLVPKLIQFLSILCNWDVIGMRQQEIYSDTCICIYVYVFKFLSNNKLEVIVSLLQLKGVIYSCYAFGLRFSYQCFWKFFPFTTHIYSGFQWEPFGILGRTVLVGTVFIHIVKHLYLPSLLPELNTSHDQSLW